MNFSNAIKENAQQITDYLAAFLVFVLPFSTALPNILLIPLILIIGLNFRRIKWTKSYPFLFFGMAISILIVLALYNKTFLDEIDLFSKYFLILFLFILFTQVTNKKYCEYALLLGLIIAMLISSFSIGKQLLENPDFLLDSGKIVNKLLLLERPYFGFMLTVGIFICLKNAEKSSRKYIYYLFSVFFAAFTIYISARLAMGLIGLLFFTYLFKSTQIHRKTKISFGILLALLFIISMGLSNNLMSRMHIKDDLDKTIHLIKVYEPRFVIWPCAVDIALNEMNFLTGLKSNEEVEQQLTQCYSQIEREGKRQYYLKARFNSHNQFLCFLLLGGIVPFLLLISMFSYTFLSKKNSFELKVLFFLFLSFFMVENVLHRQLGCYLFGIFVALYSTKIDE